MLSPVWVDATKLENVSQYATLVGYCSYKERAKVSENQD